MNKKIIWVVLVIIIIIIAIVITRSPGQKSNSINIGAVLSLSGIAATDGESIKDGLELAKTDLKNQGVDVNIIYQDDKTDGKGTVSAMQAVATQGVQAIIGPTWSFLADAGIPVADKLHIVTVMPSNTSEFVSSKSDYAFFSAIKVSQMSPILSDWLKASGKKKLAIIGAKGPWFSTVESVVKDAVTKAGAAIVYSDEMVYGQEVSVMPTMMAKVKYSGADVLFAENDNEASNIIMLKDLASLGIHADVISIATGVGKVVNENQALITGNNGFYVLAPKQSLAFQDKFKAVYGKTPRAYADAAYDSLMFVVDAIQHRGNMALKDYLKTTTNYKGYATTYKFDFSGDIIGGDWMITKVK